MGRKKNRIVGSLIYDITGYLRQQPRPIAVGKRHILPSPYAERKTASKQVPPSSLIYGISNFNKGSVITGYPRQLGSPIGLKTANNRGVQPRPVAVVTTGSPAEIKTANNQVPPGALGSFENPIGPVLVRVRIIR